MYVVPRTPHEFETEIFPTTDTYIDGNVLDRLIISSYKDSAQTAAYYVNPWTESIEPPPPSALRDFVPFVVAFAA